MSRRILTTATVDELLAAGATELRLGPGDIVTALAREYARDKGVRLIPETPRRPRPASRRRPRASTPPSSTRSATSPTASTPSSRAP